MKTLLWPKLFNGHVCSGVVFNDQFERKGYGDGLGGGNGDWLFESYASQGNSDYVNYDTAYGDLDGNGTGEGLAHD